MVTDTRSNPPDEAGEVPSGWRVVASSPAVVDLIDALLDLPAHREFNKKELSRFADVSRKSVHTHLDLLLQLGVVEEVPETTPTRYRFNPESEVAELLIRLDGAVNRAGPYADEGISSE